MNNEATTSHMTSHCFNSMMALGKLLKINVQPLDPGVNVVPGIIVVAAFGVCHPGS